MALPVGVFLLEMRGPGSDTLVALGNLTITKESPVILGDNLVFGVVINLV
ncbi:hypothetical protein [Thalassobacillus sp. B23F22_16]